ncbi:unnamed protein product [Ectocarpus sp. 12 AP-2014]
MLRKCDRSMLITTTAVGFGSHWVLYVHRIKRFGETLPAFPNKPLVGRIRRTGDEMTIDNRVCRSMYTAVHLLVQESTIHNEGGHVVTSSKVWTSTLLSSGTCGEVRVSCL